MTSEFLPKATHADREIFQQGTIQGVYDIFHGRFPLHASAVALDQGAILFTGQSGAGKSTHAAWFLQKGYSLVSDDVSRVNVNEQGIPLIEPAIPQMKLWDDALRHFGEDPDQLPTVPGRLDKRRLSDSIPLVTGPLPVRAILHLVPVDDEPYAFRQLQGMAAWEVIAQNIYRGFVIPALGKVREHFAFCSQLAGAVTVFEVRRPRGQFVMDQVHADLTRWLDTRELV